VPKVPGIRNPRSDNTAPTIPGDLVATALSATSIGLTWSASTDNVGGVGVAGYQVWKNGSPLTTTTSLSYTAIGLTAATAYEFNVSAYDEQGNMSPLSETATATTSGSTNATPVWQTIAQQELTTGTNYSLPLGSFVSDTDGPSPVTVTQISGTLPTGVTYNATTKIVSGTPTAASTPTVVFRASDGLATADVSVVFNCLGADTTAPSVPANLAGTAFSRQRIDLTWSASSQRSSGLAGYKLYRDGSLRTTLGVGVTSYSDTGLNTGASYSYAIAAYDLAGNNSAQSSAVAVATATNSAPEWVTPAALPTVPYPVTSTVTMRLLATDDDGDPITYSSSATLPSGVTLTELTSPLGALLTIPAGTAAGVTPFTVSAVDTSPGAGTTESWATRSTRPGVVWAIDFQEANELSYFLQGQDLPSSGGTTAAGTTNPPAQPFLPYVRNETRFGSSKVLVSKCYGTTLDGGITAGQTSIAVTSAADFPDPASQGYFLLIGVPSDDGFQEWVYVTGKSGNTLTVVRGRDDSIARAFVTGTPIGVAPTGKWTRPMSAFPATQNGKSSPDVGIVNGYRSRTWPFAHTRAHGRYRGGYWGHSSYRTSYDASFPVSPYTYEYTSPYSPPFTNTWDGTEFYIQFRMKVDAARFSAAPGKLFYLQNASGSTAQQLYFNVNPPGSGHRLNIATNGQGNGQPILTPIAWDIPEDIWVTYLIHMIPGRQGVAETTCEVFAAIEGAISYTTILSGATFAWNYEFDLARDPPAFNSFSPTNYANAYVGPGSVGAPSTTNSVEYTQIILSSNTIAVPA
jgi:chitodextrinase